ncbi:hypothetical protein BDZ89DRAFT_623670 [Hymenopellis radicata]|nr:hypothetical protein BDZ89DRAFT_623670 [Hymenopellis radicata]
MGASLVYKRMRCGSVLPFVLTTPHSGTPTLSLIQPPGRRRRPHYSISTVVAPQSTGEFPDCSMSSVVNLVMLRLTRLPTDRPP